MNIVFWGLRFLIPFVVLFTLGYYVPGFSALTISWLIVLSALTVLGDWLVNSMIGGDISRWGRGVITFLINAVVVFFTTYAIDGGHVPLGASVLAALIIAAISNLVNFRQLSKGVFQER
ncbi:MAG: hypothetical protein ACM3YE_12600 [Bacteroidota bacterium]